MVRGEVLDPCKNVFVRLTAKIVNSNSQVVNLCSQLLHVVTGMSEALWFELQSSPVQEFKQ
jgi:hypothetical protein